MFLSSVKFCILNLRVLCSHADLFFHHCLVLYYNNCTRRSC